MRLLLQLVLIGFSGAMIVGGDEVWKQLCPQKFWKRRVAELQASAKKDRWILKSVEWEVMKQRIELTIAVSEAKDKAECLGLDCGPYVGRAKEEARLLLHHLMKEESKAKLAYLKTMALLKEAEDSLMQLQKGLEASR